MVIIHSKDLVNWTIKGHVVSDLRQISEEMNWTRMNRYGRGIWAGAIRYYQGKFYVYFGTPDEGYFRFSTVCLNQLYNKLLANYLRNSGNELVTVRISVICGAMLSNNSL